MLVVDRIINDHRARSEDISNALHRIMASIAGAAQVKKKSQGDGRGVAPRTIP
jgi:hypothetical protein